LFDKGNSSTVTKGKKGKKRKKKHNKGGHNSKKGIIKEKGISRTEQKQANSRPPVTKISSSACGRVK
jgi:hypothetical protein